jgi:glycosyltransferase involved in cell wall biosynthesis
VKILFDHQMFSLQRYGGVSRYFAGLNKGINAGRGNSSKISVLYSENEYLKDQPPVFNNTIGRGLFAGKQDLIYKWNKKFSKRYMKFGNYDILHPTYFDPYFIKYNKKPLVITVHDMIYENLPQLFPDSAHVIAHKKQVIEKADAIIAISEYTKQEITRFYPEVKDRISVVHHGYTLNTTTADTGLTLPVNYILFVGERWHYKNFVPFVKAIKDLLKDDEQLHLICAGGGKFTSAEKEVLAELDITGKCSQLSVTDAGLKQLYSQAKLFVFPALQEGFGLPLLEAFANNCPVACSNATCFPEIAGDAALYFDPTDELSINTAVKTLINNEDARQQLIKKGQQKLKAYPFQKCIDNTIQVYSTLLKSHLP